MSRSLAGDNAADNHSTQIDLGRVQDLYLTRYDHKPRQAQKSDMLLYGLIVAAIDNFDTNVAVSIERLAEVTFAEVEEIQEHLPLLLEVYPKLGEYYEKKQEFVKN